MQTPPKVGRAFSPQLPALYTLFRIVCKCVLLSLSPFLFLLYIRSSFSEFAQRNAKDERFKAVEKMREREQLFSEYLQELKKSGASSASSARNRGERTDSGGATNSSAKTKHDMVYTHVVFVLCLSFCKC